VTVTLDKTTNLLATASCPEAYNSIFVEGSEPKETCDRADQRNVFQKIFGGAAPAPPPVNQPGRVVAPNQPRQASGAPGGGQPAPANGQPSQEDRRRGFWGKVVGIFGGDDKDKNKDQDGNNSSTR
jgi:penicillin-binding protein 1B